MHSRSTSITSSPSASSSSSFSAFSALGFATSSSDSGSSAIAEKIAATGGSSISPPYSPSHSRSHSPKRSISLPSKFKIPFTTTTISSPRLNKSPIIGLGLGGPSSPMISIPGSSTPPSSSNRSTARRISYNLKSRASHHSLPLTIGGLFTLALFIYIKYINNQNGLNEVSRFNNLSRLQLYGRSRFSNEEHSLKQQQEAQKYHKPDYEPDNGISLLLDEDELIAEDDLFWDTYKEAKPKTKEEIEQEKELKKHKEDVIKQDKIQSLRALIWWLAEGGILPNDFKPPTKQHLKKLGGRGFERLLEDIDSGTDSDDDNSEIFDNGWAEFANRRYRVVIFSKTHCPYSKKAKSIFGEYHISPAPFIIELDQRSDMDKIQTLLQRITGRRTVPNVLLDFESIGGSDDVTLLHSEGGLQRKLEDSDLLPFSRRRRPAPVVPVEPVPEVVAEPAEPIVEEQSTIENIPEVIGEAEAEFNEQIKRQIVEEPEQEEILSDTSAELSPTQEEVSAESEEDVLSDASPDNQEEMVSTPIGNLENDILIINNVQPRYQHTEVNTNAQRLVNKRKIAPGTGTLEFTSWDERGSWKNIGNNGFKLKQ
ncbi:glutaredoxin [Kwoniella dendrophila CBS 6074]|uniref:Glutaredoxin n=1 Tax=Kwoniella dendrophila CBS 6074 TaxID=1295534 RepID=A0AAX4JWD4_9TREE